MKNAMRVIQLLSAAGYRVEFVDLPADGVGPAGPAVSLRWENCTTVTRGVDHADALHTAAEFVMREVEKKRISELMRRGDLHALIGAELARPS